jgi:poly-gamma-glutamate capsule biosynthesis protein CapA/YwtB (metallophosphatase superfamily)
MAWPQLGGARVKLFAVGDVAPRRACPAEIFDGCRTVLRSADLVLGQIESVLSDRGSPLPQARLAMRSEPLAAAAIREAGIGVGSLAGNHCLDWGSEALADTIAHARGAGIAVCGAGLDETEARSPAMVEAAGQRVAVLAYSSILPQDYQATGRRGGCAPMRAHTVYHQVEHDQPGTPARTLTFSHREDLAALARDVARAREVADFVAVSIHWGIHFVPAEIADYQREIAYAAIDAGAGAVLGHHPHILKGIEMRRGRPIFYSLGNFAIEQPQAFAADVLSSRGFEEIRTLNKGFDPGRAYIAPPDTQKSMIAKLQIEGGEVVRVAYQPVQIGDDAVPRVLSAGDSRFEEIGAYVEAIGRSQGLRTQFTVDGDDVVVSAA